MNTTKNTRGVSEAMVMRGLAAWRETSPSSSGIPEVTAILEAALSPEPAAQGEADAPSIEAAEAMGAKGGPAVEAERLAFEAWMKGHCWTLGATWRDGAYRSDAEQGGKLCPHAMQTRGLWAAWRDRAALAAPPAQPAERVPEGGWVLVPREALGYVSDLLTERKHGTAGRSPAHNARVVVDYWLTATPAPSEGGKGVDGYVAFTCEEVREAYVCMRKHNCTIPDECLDQMRDVLLTAAQQAAR